MDVRRRAGPQPYRAGRGREIAQFEAYVATRRGVSPAQSAIPDEIANAIPDEIVDKISHGGCFFSFFEQFADRRMLGFVVVVPRLHQHRAEAFRAAA